jgi:predicted secreted Zn-dependent protease
VSARSLVAALALLAGPGFTACSSPPPAPQPAVVETSVSTTYYPVRGTTTSSIFAAIDANGLAEKSGQRAVGVTSAEWQLTSGDVDVRVVPCVFPSLTVRLHLVVALPRHEAPEALPADLRDHWERFVGRVAAHEQRHVDIYLEGANAMKTRLEATRTAVSCADLEKAIDAAWQAQQADIDGRRRSSTPRTRPRRGASATRCRPGSKTRARGSSP